MSQFYSEITWRKSKEQILNIYKKLSKSFENKIEKGTNLIPALYSDKKDFGDIDFFWKLKKDTKISEKEILEILSKNWFIVGGKLKLKLEKEFSNNQNIDLKKMPLIYKNDIEYTLLAYNTEDNEYYHIDITLINEKEDWVRFDSYYEYYKKPFFSYHLWIILRPFNIAYTSKGVFYRLPQQVFWSDEKILITNNLTKFLGWLDNFYPMEDEYDIVSLYRGYLEIEKNVDIINTLELSNLFNYINFISENLKYEEKRKLSNYEVNEELNNLILERKVNNIDTLSKQWINDSTFIKNIDRYKNELNTDVIEQLKPYMDDFYIYFKDKFDKKNQIYSWITIELLTLNVFYSLLNYFDSFQNNLTTYITKKTELKQQQKFKVKLYTYLLWDNYKKRLWELYKNKNNYLSEIKKIEDIITNYKAYYNVDTDELIINNELMELKKILN